jgi:cell division transport system permease protein
MMMPFVKRAMDDIFQNRFLNLITIITLAMAILIASTFILFLVNTREIINSWQRGLRIMAYLEPGIRSTELTQLMRTIRSLDGVDSLRYISKQAALDRLKAQMAHQSSIFDNLAENPLPDSFEIRMTASSGSWQKIESLAIQIESLALIEEVQYGRRWLGRFVRIVSLFRMAGYAMSALFFIATVFIVANTIRLVFYSRREEVEIMRLAGATDNFIKIPFYIQGLIQGVLGGAIGLVVLYISFFLISASVEQGFSPDFLRLRFLSPLEIGKILLGSLLVGWLGCYVSLKQFLKA